MSSPGTAEKCAVIPHEIDAEFADIKISPLVPDCHARAFEPTLEKPPQSAPVNG